MLIVTDFFQLIMQLYVSVDAATKDSLKAIDRPLFGDFWERFVVRIFLILKSIICFILSFLHFDIKIYHLFHFRLSSL